MAGDMAKEWGKGRKEDVPEPGIQKNRSLKSFQDSFDGTWLSGHFLFPFLHSLGSSLKSGKLTV